MTVQLNLKWLLIPVMVMYSQAAFSQKKVISITTSIEVAATRPEVYTLLKNLQRYPEWSPFVVEDPKQKNSVSGINGEIASVFHWEGVAEKSKGYQVLSDLKADEYIRYDCTIEVPFKGKPVFEYRLSKKGDKVEVIQEFNLHLSGFSYFMTKLFGVKKKMAETNKLGLDRFKTLVEKESTSTSSSR
jgi:uncharacterized membrane protein